MKTKPFDYTRAILQRMDELNLTQADLADISGVSEATISQLIRGGTMPRWDTVEDVLNALGMELTVRDAGLVERIKALVDPDPDDDWKLGKNFGLMMAVLEIEKGENDGDRNNDERKGRA